MADRTTVVVRFSRAHRNGVVACVGEPDRAEHHAFHMEGAWDDVSPGHFINDLPTDIPWEGHVLPATGIDAYAFAGVRDEIEECESNAAGIPLVRYKMTGVLPADKDNAALFWFAWRKVHETFKEAAGG